MIPAAPPLVQIQNISKAYGGVQALRDVSFDMSPAHVHALCGENGAGKSTLIKILAGSVDRDAGQVLINGLPLSGGSVRASESAGIAVIHQESVAFPHLSTFDNIFVGREPRRFGNLLLDHPRIRRETRALLDRLGEQFDPTCPVGQLSLAQRQMVGIARALSQDCKLLIMDEPTASLSARETKVLFRLIRQLQSEGVAILYVSHRLDEIFELSGAVTVLRDGRHVETKPTRELTKETLIKLMVGRDLLETDAKFSRKARPARPTILQVKNLTRAPVFNGISFNLHEGEILGLSGLVGAGRSEIAHTIFGIDKRDSGEVVVNGLPLRGHSVREAMHAGLAFVPEDRQHLGLVLPMSVGANLSLAKLPEISTFGVISSSKERDLVQQLIQTLAVKAAGPHVAAQTLSGGNQQKIVLGKWLGANPKILILDEPTRGVDVGAKAEVHRLIHRLADEGMATLLISSDLPEILAMSDRILVMRAGHLAGELARRDATQEKVLQLAILAGAAA